MQEEKPAETTLDWKPDGHTALGPRIEPGLSGPQHGRRTATLPASPNNDNACPLLVIVVSWLTAVREAISQNERTENSRYFDFGGFL